MAKTTELCARCGIAPRNSTLKSYCVDCKRALGREADQRRRDQGRPDIPCSRCGGERTGRHPAYCVDCWKAKRAERATQPCARCGCDREPTDKTNSVYCNACWRNWWLKRNYGISLEEYTALLAAQGERCAICRKESNGRQWHVDHSHATGEVRGLLCDKCNRGLGHFDEEIALLRRAADYLEAAGAPVCPSVVLNGPDES